MTDSWFLDFWVCGRRTEKEGQLQISSETFVAANQVSDVVVVVVVLVIDVPGRSASDAYWDNGVPSFSRSPSPCGAVCQSIERKKGLGWGEIHQTENPIRRLPTLLLRSSCLLSRQARQFASIGCHRGMKISCLGVPLGYFPHQITSPNTLRGEHDMIQPIHLEPNLLTPSARRRSRDGDQMLFM